MEGITVMKLSRKHFEFIADTMGATATWPTQIEAWADALEKTNPKFNRKKFVDRAVLAWEKNYSVSEIDDEIRY